MFKHLIASTVLLFASSSACQAFEIYGGASVFNGYTVGFSQHLDKKFAIRAEYNYLSYSHDDITIGDIDWDGKFENASGGFYSDYFPFGGNFHLTAGAAFGDFSLTATGSSANGYYDINGERYYVSGEYINSSVTASDVRPYLGFGWGHSYKSGFGISFDLGVYYTTFEYTITASDALASLAADDIAEEQQSGQDDLDDYRFIPALSLLLTYTF